MSHNEECDWKWNPFLHFDAVSPHETGGKRPLLTITFYATFSPGALRAVWSE